MNAAANLAAHRRPVPRIVRQGGQSFIRHGMVLRSRESARLACEVQRLREQNERPWLQRIHDRHPKLDVIGPMAWGLVLGGALVAWLLGWPR